MKGFYVLSIFLMAEWMLPGQPAGSADKPRVGDWVSMKIIGKPGAQVILKQTLVAKNETTATIKNDQILNDKVLQTKETNIPLEQLRDPAKLALKLEKSKLEKANTGKETLDIGGKKLACDWTEFKVSFIAAGKNIEVSSKIWTSPDIPVNGMVKLENQQGGMKTSSMELVDYGRGK